MRSILFSLLALTIIICSVGFSNPKKVPKATSPLTTYHGYLVDKMCSPDMTEKGSEAYETAAEHTKACLIEPQCLKSGFGMVTAEDKWIPFDKSGSQKAGQLAVLTEKTDHVAVEVQGRMKAGTLLVTSIKEE